METLAETSSSLLEFTFWPGRYQNTDHDNKRIVAILSPRLQTEDGQLINHIWSQAYLVRPLSKWGLNTEKKQKVPHRTLDCQCPNNLDTWQQFTGALRSQELSWRPDPHHTSLIHLVYLARINTSCVILGFKTSSFTLPTSSCITVHTYPAVLPPFWEFLNWSSIFTGHWLRPRYWWFSKCPYIIVLGSQGWEHLFFTEYFMEHPFIRIILFSFSNSKHCASVRRDFIFHQIKQF